MSLRRVISFLLGAASVSGSVVAGCSDESARDSVGVQDASFVDASRTDGTAALDAATDATTGDAADAPDGSIRSAWRQRIGGAGIDNAMMPVFDALGNTYVVGRFSGAIAPGGLDAGSSTGVFVAKFDPQGNLLWLEQIGPLATSAEVQIDPAGNVVVGFDFQGTIGVGGQKLTSAGGFDFGIAKFSSEGKFLLGKRYGGAGDDLLNALVTSPGGIVVGGHYDGTPDYGLGPQAAADGSDAFILALDANGTPVWGKAFGGPLDDDVYDLVYDPSGKLIATGRTSGTVDLGGGPLVAAGATDAYVAVFTAAGTFVRAQRWGGAGTEEAAGVGVDATGNVYVTGYLFGSADFGGGLLTSAQGGAFVISTDPNGAHRWSKALVGTDYSAPGFRKPIAVNGAGTVLLTGRYKGTIDFDGGALTSKGLVDTYLLELTSSGTHTWSTSYGGVGDDQGNGVALSADGWKAVAGGFSATSTFDGTDLTAAGATDAFVLTTK